MPQLEKGQGHAQLKHVAIVMDGNGRWAQKRLLPREVGHRKGLEVVKEAILFCVDKKIKYLSLFAFSTENWKRPKKEVDQLMSLFNRALIEVMADGGKKLNENNICLRMIGEKQELPVSLVEQIKQVENNTKDNNQLFLQICVNYGGRLDLVNMVQKLLKKQVNENIDIDSIDEEYVSQFLYTAGTPDPDLLIRTGGEHRISNFMLWQLAYTELYFVDKSWPEFCHQDFQEAVDVFSHRKRRFGGIK